MVKHILTLMFLFILFTDVNGQITLQPKQQNFEYKGIIYRKEVYMDFCLSTNGASLGLNFSKIGAFQSTKYYHYEIATLSDPREKSQNKNLAVSYNDISSSFKFGKQNHVIMLRAGVGKKKFLSDKAKRKGIAIGYDMEIGPTLAVLIPYYLDLIYTETQGGVTNLTIKTEKYNSDNADTFLDYDRIYGGTGYFTGFGEASVQPGIQGKLGLLFSLGQYDKTIKALEVGLMADVFFKKIPIMVETDNVKNKPYFLNFYLTFQFGKRKI
ncbi:MAG: hypothetical protein R2766_01540 [Saprospiraceae bacterium]